VKIGTLRRFHALTLLQPKMVGVGRLALPRLVGFEPNWSAIPYLD